MREQSQESHPLPLLRSPGPARPANRKWLYPLLAVLALTVVVIAGIGVHRWQARKTVEPALAGGVSLSSPDAFIDTQSLSSLPKDLLTAPVLRELATEDLFFYYREDEGRLGLEGALRRIGFEHDLNLGDRFIAMILDRPARIAFWKSRDGRLGRWLMVVRREGLLPVLEALAKTALDDSQLRIAGQLPGRGELPVYELRHGPRLTLYFANAGEHLLVFSDADILLRSDEAGRANVEELLEEDDPADAWAESFRLDGKPHVHLLAVSANYLSLGYQALFPALRALRFDYDAGGWQAAVSSAEPFPSTAPVWNVMPDHPAFCAAVPVDPEKIAGLLSKFIPAHDAERLADALQPPAAICWYDKAKLYAPLVAIRKKSAASLDASLRPLFNAAIGTREAGVEQPAPAASPGPQGEAPPDTVTVYQPPFEIAEEKRADTTVWRREVSSPYGTKSSEDSDHGAEMRSARYFTVALAERQDALLFSPDAALVDDALAALEGRYPALGDALPEGGETAAVMYPDRLVSLLETTVLDSLPDEREPVFRVNVSERLLPQLAKLKNDRILRLPAPVGNGDWEPLQWAGQR